MRKLEGLPKILIGIWLTCASLFYLYTATVGILAPRLMRSIHLAFMLPMAFILFPATKKSPKDRIPLFDYLLAGMALIVSLFIMYSFDRLEFRFETITEVLPIEVILGTIAVLLLVEAVRRAVAPAMSIIIVVAIAYFFASPYLPGIANSPQISYARIIENFYLLRNDGIYGNISGIAATLIAIFIIFGAFIENSGLGELFMDLSCKIAGGSRGGPAKVAVISSGFFGMISGSAVANVYGTGTFTIPLMKSLGYTPEWAGAVEATASTGGKIMPPVMGAAAFVMADMLGIPYIKIAIAASLGAVLYFLAVGIMVHYEAVKLGLKGMSKEQLKAIPWKKILKKIYLLFPMIALVYLLLKGYSPYLAAFYAIVFSIVLSFFSKEKTMLNPIRLLKTLESGSRNLITIAVACAGVGIITSAIVNTGFGLGLSSGIITLSHGNLFISLFLVMCTCLLLGMGVPGTPAYILTAAVGAPALLNFGLGILPVHLFVFYFSCLAEVTPPVALAAYAGASIAKGDTMKTGWIAYGLAFTGFLIPYAFIYNNSLILQGSLYEIINATFFLIVAIFLLTATVVGFIKRQLTIWERVLPLLFVPLFVFPILSGSLLIWARILVTILIVFFFMRNKKSPDKEEINHIGVVN